MMIGSHKINRIRRFWISISRSLELVDAPEMFGRCLGNFHSDA